ncbi:MAG: hypothetical protein LBR53_01020 [Deltaproteobacteria bacterium]|nr:hypothetical protein [Deltaproteobacteria bacterium]
MQSATTINLDDKSTWPAKGHLYIVWEEHDVVYGIYAADVISDANTIGPAPVLLLQNGEFADYCEHGWKYIKFDVAELNISVQDRKTFNSTNIKLINSDKLYLVWPFNTSSFDIFSFCTDSNYFPDLGTLECPCWLNGDLYPCQNGDKYLEIDIEGDM